MIFNWRTDLKNIPTNKFIELKCEYMFINFEIIATITEGFGRGEVADEFKNTELEEMFYRSKIVAWRSI